MLKRANFIDCVISSAISLYACIILYSILYPVCNYSNLKDFYVGETIYFDHNKYLDLGIVFIYILLFFCVIPFIIFLREKLIKIQLPKISLPKIQIGKYPQFIFKYQWIGLIGYLTLYPMNGQIYPLVILLIAMLIGISLIDLYMMRKRGDCEKFSNWVITSVLLILFVNLYFPVSAPGDMHHCGETYATFLMHDKFNLAYYKDIMLVHGYSDVAFGFIGKYIFLDNTVYGYKLGELLLSNIYFVFISVMLLYIFNSSKIFVVPFLCLVPDLIQFFICSFLLLLKKEIFNKKFTWLILYIIMSYIFMMYRTTIGSFWVLASLPVAVYILYQFLKSVRGGVEKNSILKIVLLILLPVVFFIIGHDVIISYLKEAKYYVDGNLYAFGLNLKPFRYFTYPIIESFHYVIRFFVYIVCPFFIVELIKEFSKKERNIRFICFLIFVVLLPIFSINYLMGRIDGYGDSRTLLYSLPYIWIIVPYFLYTKYKDNIILKIFLIILFMLIIYKPLGKLIYTYTDKFYQEKQSKKETILNNVGDANIYYQDIVENLKILVDTNSDQNDVYLDLINSGMNYLYLDKPIPIKYVSFYNSISTKQALNSVERIKNNPPKVIVIGSSNFMCFDKAYLSLRMNPLYRWLFLNNNYEIIVSKYYAILVKTEYPIVYTKEILKMLDFLILKLEDANIKLKFLPEVWANSLNTLPMMEIKKEYDLKTNKHNNTTDIIITFKQPIKGSEIDLLYFNPFNIKDNKYVVSVNNSTSNIMAESKTGHILLPMDAAPSWLLNKSLSEIKLKINKDININDLQIRFYKRNSSLEI